MTFVGCVGFVGLQNIFAEEDRMPIRRYSLCGARLATYRAATQELLRAGLIANIPEELETSRALDIIIAPRYENILWQLPNGSTCCAILARLLGRRGDFILNDFAISSEWDPDFIPLCAKEKSSYRLPCAFDFSWDEVLNHRFEDGLRFHRRGDVAEGLLLAVGYKPIPDKYRNRMLVTLNVTLTDQFGDPHCARAEALLERSVRRVDHTAQPKEFGGLYGTGWCEPEARVDQANASTLKSPTKNGAGETPSRMKNLAVGRKHLDAG
jgi:hypothetical protein